MLFATAANISESNWRNGSPADLLPAPFSSLSRDFGHQPPSCQQLSLA